ncbi:MAG TPA: hypothetical protein VEC39_06295 [Vicinamibacterales bacterium]|nr:hypothetical protein [Vicinamibacterales bacterium]
MPFLRLTRDRRGFENTFLLHADRPGDKPRLLYWYRTAPGLIQGRPALDEDAIRTIEESHPDIDFDWPAILALSEVMIHEEEAPAKPARQTKKPRREREPAPRREEQPVDDPVDEQRDEDAAPPALNSPAPAPSANRLLEELAGREIAARLRARYTDIVSRIEEKGVDDPSREGWLKRAAAINPELWVTPEAILEGVRNADAVYDQLRSELAVG